VRLIFLELGKLIEPPFASVCSEEIRECDIISPTLANEGLILIFIQLEEDVLLLTTLIGGVILSYRDAWIYDGHKIDFLVVEEIIDI
jgi:hypothetical protein